MPPPKIDVATNIARVPFCSPHSIVIVFFCSVPEASNWATKYATTIITTLSTKVIRPACAKYETTFSFSAAIAPNKTSIKSTVDTFLAIGSNFDAILEINLLTNIPNITGTVTIKNMSRDMSIIEIS